MSPPPVLLESPADGVRLIRINSGGGATQRLTSAIGKRKAMRYLLTGDPFSARDACAMGLVSELVQEGGHGRFHRETQTEV